MLYACKYDDIPCVVGLAPSYSRRQGLQEVFGYDDTLDIVAKKGRAEVVWRGVKDPRKPHIFFLTKPARYTHACICLCVFHIGQLPLHDTAVCSV